MAQTIDRPATTLESTPESPSRRRRWPLVVAIVVAIGVSATAAWAVPQAGAAHRATQRAASEQTAIAAQQAIVAQAVAQLDAARQQLDEAQARVAALRSSARRSVRQIKAMQAQVKKLQADLAAQAAARQSGPTVLAIRPPVFEFCYYVIDPQTMKKIWACEKVHG